MRGTVKTSVWLNIPDLTKLDTQLNSTMRLVDLAAIHETERSYLLKTEYNLEVINEKDILSI